MSVWCATRGLKQSATFDVMIYYCLFIYFDCLSYANLHICLTVKEGSCRLVYLEAGSTATRLPASILRGALERRFGIISTGRCLQNWHQPSGIMERSSQVKNDGLSHHTVPLSAKDANRTKVVQEWNMSDVKWEHHLSLIIFPNNKVFKVWKSF